MEINKIGSTNPIQSTQNTERVNSAKTLESSSKDNVSVSEDAKIQAAFSKALYAIENAPDIRMDKIEEAKKLLESLKNPSDDILEDVSKKILGELGIA